MAVAESVNDEVVDGAAMLVEQQRVLRMPGADPVEVVGQHPLAEVVRALAAQLELAHVRDVEHAGGRPHREMLGDDPLVLDRHLPAGERNNTRAGRNVAVVQRGPAQRGLLSHPEAQSTQWPLMRCPDGGEAAGAPASGSTGRLSPLGLAEILQAVRWRV